MIDPRVAAVVALGAAIGGVLRLILTQFVAGRFGVNYAFYATLFINVSGSFLIGMVLEFAQLRVSANPLWRYFLATGILGGYTTFSTFAFEALRLFSGAMTGMAIVYIFSSVGLGIVGSLLGIATVKAFAH